MAKFAAASDLFERVVENNVAKVEEYLKLGDSPLWRELIRYEFDMSDISHPRLQSHHLLTKLVAYEIKTLSSFHVAALLGFNDVLMALMDKDIPIDMATVTGTTALHMACFAGKLDTVNLLREIYKADLTRRDRYGWSALHYASSEGHLKVVQSLIRLGLDVKERDQDGTTAAFRAKVNNHDHVVEYLLQHGSEEEMLNIDETLKYKNKEDEIAALYSKCVKPAVKPRILKKPVQLDSKKALPDYSSYAQTHLNGKAKRYEEIDLVTSAPGDLNRSLSEPVPAPRQVTFKQQSYSVTDERTDWETDPGEKDTTIRRLIRKELEKSFGDSEYETPISVQNSLAEDDLDRFSNCHIGTNTLTGLMRQEFERYKRELAMNQPPSHPAPPPVSSKDDTEYEDLYASLANLPAPPPPPPTSLVDAPPLPPRNPSMNTIYKETLAPSNNALILTSDGTNFGLTECFRKLSPCLGRNWKKLAHALPLDSSPSKVDVMITDIEKEHASNIPAQALQCLIKWRRQKGQDASIDDLIIALRKSNLHILIPVVETVAQEFTA